MLIILYRPKGDEEYQSGMLPTIAPPPVQQAAFVDSSPRFNPFDSQSEITNDSINNEIPYGKFNQDFYYLNFLDNMGVSYYMRRIL